jgi:putative sterol carrier protein
MPAIHTKAWYNSVRDLINNNPDVAKSAPRGTFKVLGELRGDGRSPYLRESERRFFVIHFDNGYCTDYDQVDAPPPRKEFDFIFEIPASVFEGIAAGIVDPVGAGLRGAMKISGDMRVLIRHAGLVNVMRKVYTQQVETTWPAGKPPYGIGDQA